MSNFLKNFFIKLKNKERQSIKIIQSHLDWEKNLIKNLAKGQWNKFPNFKQLKYFPSLLTKKEKKVFIIFSLLFILSLTTLLIKSYTKLPANPVGGGEYREGLVGELNQINPIFSLASDLNQDVVRLIFSGLVKWKDGKISPDLAENWEVKDEGKTYIFHLRKEVFWHDRKKMNVDDVIFTIKAIQNKRIDSPLRTSLEGVKVRKIDDYTLEFFLEKPLSSFPSFLTFGILPKHLWEKVPFENFASDKLNFSPIGTGPFKFKDLSKDNEGKIIKITLERNEKYYLGVPLIQKINLKFFNNYDDAWNSLITKKIDGLSSIKINETPETFPKIFSVHKVPISYYTAIFFNQKSFIASNKKIRQALALSLDKKKFIENFRGIEIIEAPIINPNFKSEEIEKYDYSLEGAEKNLKEEGYQKKKGWFVDKKNNPLTIDFIVLDRSINKEIGKTIKNFWEKLGVKTNLQILNKEDFNKAIKEKKYDVVLQSIIEGYDPDPFPLWHSSRIGKESNIVNNFKDIKIDVALEKARMSFDEEERKKYYHEFQKIISKEVPAIFLYQRVLTYFQNKEIKGFEANFLPFPADRFSKIESWYIFTKK